MFRVLYRRRTKSECPEAEKGVSLQPVVASRAGPAVIIAWSSQNDKFTVNYTRGDIESTTQGEMLAYTLMPKTSRNLHAARIHMPLIESPANILLIHQPLIRHPRRRKTRRVREQCASSDVIRATPGIPAIDQRTRRCKPPYIVPGAHDERNGHAH